MKSHQLREVSYARAFLVPRHGGGARCAPVGHRPGPDPRRLHAAGHRLVLSAGHPGELHVARDLGRCSWGPRRRPRQSRNGCWAGAARLRLHERVLLPEDDGEVLVIEIDGKAAPTATEQELARRRRNAGRSRTGLPVSAASRPGETAAAGPQDAAEEGGEEQERPQRHAGGDVHLAAGRRTAGCTARSTRRCSARSVRGSRRWSGAGAGDAPRVPARDRQDGADRHRRRDLPGAATAAAVPRRDPDAGRAARAGEALGGGPVVPPRRARGVDALGRGPGRSCSTRGRSGRCCSGWSRRCEA